ncbi:hypothetical protein [Calidifontibacter terrae]
MSRTSLRVASAALAAVTGLGLAGCSNDGSVAASLGSTHVSSSEVQSAVDDITKEQPKSQFDPQSAIAYLVLGPSINDLAKKYGVFVSTAQAKAQFKTVEPSQAAVSTVQSNLNMGNLQNSATGSAAFGKLLKTAKVKMNPRYGQWVAGQGPNSGDGNWIKQTALTTPAS